MQVNNLSASSFEISIEPYNGDLSHVADYLDELKFQLLTQIEPYKNNHIWTAVSLHGFGPTPFDIFKPGFVKNNIKIDSKLQWTTLCNDPVMKPICEMIFKLPCEFERVRFMKLAAGKSLRKHTDNIDIDIERKKIVRLHIPIRTNKDVVFTIYENAEDDIGKELNLMTGRYYYLDVTKPHSVSNNSDIDRYHLVVDCFVNEALNTML
tara:strand:+ start:1044 stop:1667 length:624 start_codon:yes stop_codon:yes gene_type:complete